MPLFVVWAGSVGTVVFGIVTVLVPAAGDVPIVAGAAGAAPAGICPVTVAGAEVAKP